MVLKRKPSTHTTCIDSKKKNTPKKTVTKADFLEEMNLVKQLNENLEQEIKKNEINEKKHLERIRELEERIELLSMNKPLDCQGSSRGTQTHALGCTISCNLCIYEATCEDEFNWHMEDAHDKNTRNYFEKVFLL